LDDDVSQILTPPPLSVHFLLVWQFVDEKISIVVVADDDNADSDDDDANILEDNVLATILCWKG